MSTPEPFEWRQIKFAWNAVRLAYAGNVVVAGRSLWFLLKEDPRHPTFHQSWVEWEGGYTVSCTMSEREHALEGARLELINVNYRYHQKLLERFP